MTLTWYLRKGLTTRNIYEKYESSITYYSKAMANVKVFADKQMDNWTSQKLYAPYLTGA